MLKTVEDDTQPLSAYGISEVQATDLRARLRTFEEDWNHSGMDGYDNLPTEQGENYART